jgi:hypothetical protein
MKTKTFSGIGEYFPAQDAWAVETQGPIHDRSREHLGTSDVCIISARRLLLDAIRAVEHGNDPPHVIRKAEQNDMSDIQVVSAILPAETDYRKDWREAVKALLPAFASQ